MSYPLVLEMLRRPDAAVRAAFRCGSQVYGSANAASDEDFVAVLAEHEARRDLLFSDRTNVIVHGVATFEQALGEHSLLALECLFAPPEHTLKAPRPAFAFKLDRRQLFSSVTARSAADHDKAARRYEEDPAAARKRLFHSLRVLMFGIQIARHGKLVDFAQAGPLLQQIRAVEGGWAELETGFGPLRASLLEELSTLTRQRPQPRR